MRTKPLQLSVMAVSALAVFAVAAVLLLSGGNPAQADTATLAPDSGGNYIVPEQASGNAPPPPPPPPQTPEPTPEATATPTPAPSHPTPESCRYPAHVMNSGHVALFEAYWDSDTETLVNNPCPATLRHIPPDPETGTPERHVRTVTDADIRVTVFHATSNYKGKLVAAGTPTNEAAKQWSLGDYPFLAEGASAKDDIWVMTECPEEGPPPEGQLCLGFSGGLLHPYYWTGNVQYEFEFADEIDDIDPEDRGDVFVFRPHDEVPVGASRFDWKTTDADTNVLSVPVGDYTHRMWAFTKPGTYRFSVHAKAFPSPNLKSGLERPDAAYLRNLTSNPSTYTIHVGEMADQSVTADVRAANETDATLDPGDDVVITIQALNEDGPDQASSTKVKVELPEGLTYKNHNTTIYDSETRAWVAHSSTYDTTEHVWTVGDLAVGKAPLLTITATVAEGTRGKEQVIRANIHATEHIGTSEVVELDPHTNNNTATTTVTAHSIPNTDTMFGVRCLIDHGLAVNTDVCTEIVVFDLDAADTFGDSNAEIRNLVPDLSGTHSEYFQTFIDTNRDLGIRVKKAGYPRQPIILDLTVKDGKDEHSNPDSSIDDRIKVVIVVRGGDDYYAN